MRILFFNYEYPPLGGGAGNAAFYLLREFSKIPGLYIDLITSSEDDQYHLENVGDRIKVHKLNIGKNKRNLQYQSRKDLLIYAWKAHRFGNSLAKNCRYDLALAFFTVPCGFLAQLAGKKNKIPYVVSLRGADVPGYADRFSALYKIFLPIIKKIWSGASAVVANSEGLKQLALKSSANQEIKIINNGVDLAEFRPKSPAAENLANGKFTALCVSRLTNRKGIEYLIRAIWQLYEKNKDIYLEIVGEGDEKEKLEKLVEKLNLGGAVNFAGFVSHEKLPEFYHRADVFVLPSINEGMSNTLLEALASGLPVIVTDTGGTKELLEEGVNGYLVRMRDAGEIAEKIGLIRKNGELKIKMGKESLKKADKFSWANAAGQYVEIFEKMKK